MTRAFSDKPTTLPERFTPAFAEALDGRCKLARTVRDRFNVLTQDLRGPNHAFACSTVPLPARGMARTCDRARGDADRRGRGNRPFAARCARRIVARDLPGVRLETRGEGDPTARLLIGQTMTTGRRAAIASPSPSSDRTALHRRFRLTLPGGKIVIAWRPDGATIDPGHAPASPY